MNIVQKISKNAVSLFVAGAVSAVAAFFYMMYTTRYLGAERFGVLSFALALATIFSVFSDFGFGTMIVREVARDKSLAGKYLFNVSLVKIILGPATFMMMALTINLLNYPSYTRQVIYIVGVAVIITTFSQFLYSIFNAFEKMEYVSLSKILYSLLLLLGALIAIRSGLNIIGFAVSYLLASVIILWWNIMILKYRFADEVFGTTFRNFRIEWDFCKRAVKSAWPFFLTIVVNIIAFKIDIVMLSVMKNNTVVGWYSAAYNLIEMLMLISATFVGAAYPVLSNYHTSDKDSLRRAYQAMFKYLSMMGIPLAVGTTLLAANIISMIYKNNYGPSVAALQVLIWTIPLIFLTGMYGILLVSINKERLALKINFFCMALNIILNFILIPKYSFIGASAVTVLTSLFAFLLCFYFVSKLICKVQLYDCFMKPIIASSVMGLFIFFVEINIWGRVFMAAALYLGMLVALKAFSGEDRRLFRRIVHIKQGK